MIDCNIISNYFKERARMTDFCRIDCDDCPLHSSSRKNGYLSCFSLEENSLEKAIEIVQEWSNEHPQKTYLDDLFERFPNVRKYDDGTPVVCRNSLYELDYCIGDSCFDCWNEPMPEEREGEK